MLFETDPFGTEFDLPAPTAGFSEYQSDTLKVSCPKVYYQEDARIKAVITATYKASSRIGVPTPSYQMNAILVIDGNDPRYTESAISTFFWTYANQYRKVDQAIQMMVHRLKLDYASSDDLDEHWGEVLGVRRRAGEADEDYRTRLATHIRIITSSGTAPNILAVIDRITGYPGGCRLETYWPATVRLMWNAPNVIKAAETKDALISAAMDRALAAGISWSTAYPYKEYRMDFMKCYMGAADYQAITAISKRRGLVYHMATGLWESGMASYDADSLLYGPAATSYIAMARLRAMRTASYQMASRLVQLVPHIYTTNYSIDAAISKSMARFYEMVVRITEQMNATYQANTILV